MLCSAEISVFQKKVVTFELCMLTFGLGWPPFCRKKRFFAIKSSQMLTSNCHKKNFKNTKMLKNHFHDFDA